MVPDVVVLDVNLPDIDGFEVCTRMKAEPFLKNIAVIMLTGAKKEVEDRIKGLGLGAEDYILKPYDLDVLLARINAVIKVQKL